MDIDRLTATVTATPTTDGHPPRISTKSRYVP
jgi:hypothetical protein